MKKSLFLYLFIIAFLMNIFTYKYFTSKEKSQGNAKYNSSSLNEAKNQQLNSVENKNSNFSLLDNFRAKQFLSKENNSKDFPAFVAQVKQALLNYNKAAKGNPYCIKNIVSNKKCVIKSISILNHRWLIADFTDGDIFGEVLLSYAVADDNSISFEIIKTILYPIQGLK